MKPLCREVIRATSALVISDTARVVVVENQVSCDLMGEAAILHLGSGIYYGLDPVGARAWDLLRVPSTPRDLCEHIVGEFDVDPERCLLDMKALIDDLHVHGLVKVLDAPPS